MFSRLLIVGCLLSLANGCSSGNAYDPVAASGTVTVDGQPLTGGRIFIAPMGAEQKNATALIQPDGSFVFRTYAAGDGACPGQYQVTVLKPVSDDEEGRGSPAQDVQDFVSPDDLTITVPAEGTTDLKIELAAPTSDDEITNSLQDADELEDED